MMDPKIVVPSGFRIYLPPSLTPSKVELQEGEEQS